MTEEQKIEFTKWSDFISDNVRGKKTKEALVIYVKRLISNNTPVILDFQHLAKLLGLKDEVLARIVNDSRSFYYNYSIPKRQGGYREISSPFPVLLEAQKWIYQNILIKQPLHPNSMGFRQNISVVDNAKMHLNRPVILKMDIENFFPSIKLNRIISIFRNLGYTKKISYYLASICSLYRVLPQGGATSPAISNIITKRLDYRLSGLALKFDLKYSRYADDFTFSGKAIPVRVIDYIESIVKDESFSINKNKTKLLNENKQKIITGISISSGKLTIPKKRKREVRKNVYHILSKGLFVHQKHIKSNDPIYLERLIGYLHFWNHIEPKNEYVVNSLKALKQYSEKLSD